MSREYLPMSARQRKFNWAKKQKKQEMQALEAQRKEDLLDALKSDGVSEGLLKKGTELRDHPNFPKKPNLSLNEFCCELGLSKAVRTATHLRLLGLNLKDMATLSRGSVSAVKFSLNRANTVLRHRLDLSRDETPLRGPVLSYLYLYYLSDQLNNKLDEHNKKNFLWEGLDA